MKLLLLPLLLVGAAGWFGLRSSAATDASAASSDCRADNCRLTVQCTGPGTCLVTCYDENDALVCQREVPCDGPCEKACEKPREKNRAEKPCALGASGTR